MKKKIFLNLVLLFLFLANKKTIWASNPHFSISPSSGNFSSIFTVDLKIDTGGQAIGAADIYLLFPKELLRVENVSKGNVFPEIYSLINNQEGKLRINFWFPIEKSGESYKGDDGLLGKITFNPLKTGVANVNFVCLQGPPPETNESNIVEKTQIRDIIVCNSNINGSYNLTVEGNTPTPTTQYPNPTPTPTNLPTPTPTIPQSGNILPTLTFSILGIFTILTSISLLF